MTGASTARDVAGDLRRGFFTMVLYEIGFRLVATAACAPVGAWAVGRLVARSGSPAVSNDDIAWLLLSPLGLATAFALVVGYLLGQLVLSAGFMALAAVALAGRRLRAEVGLRVAIGSSLRLLRVGALQAVGLAWLLAPFLGAAALTYGLLLAGHDINYYLAERPPAFLAAVGVGVVLGVVLLARLSVEYVRTLFALPGLLFEGLPFRESVRRSRERTVGQRRRIGAYVLGWHALVTAVSALAGLAFTAGALAILDLAGARPGVLVAIGIGLLMLQAGLAAGLAFLQVAGASFLTVRLYDDRSGGAARRWGEAIGDGGAGELRVPGWAWWLGLGVLVLVPVGAAARMIDDLAAVRPVAITAHRGASREAPENSLAAFRRAIDAGADTIELDVHLTRDGALVVVHDEDLLRIARDPRRPGAMTLEEIKAIDIGTPFGRGFAGERIATLGEAIGLCRGRARMNIELKPVKGGESALGEAVADLIRAEQFERDCFVTSLNREAVVAAHGRFPRLKTGAIVSATVGDVTRLGVDVLSLRAGLITDRLLERAHAAGTRVHAWTIDDPEMMARLIDRGVDGLITNEPARAVAVREERQALPSWSRLVLSFRSRLDRR